MCLGGEDWEERAFKSIRGAVQKTYIFSGHFRLRGGGARNATNCKVYGFFWGIVFNVLKCENMQRNFRHSGSYMQINEKKMQNVLKGKNMQKYFVTFFGKGIQ